MHSLYKHSMVFFHVNYITSQKNKPKFGFINHNTNYFSKSVNSDNDEPIAS